MTGQKDLFKLGGRMDTKDETVGTPFENVRVIVNGGPQFLRKGGLTAGGRVEGVVTRDQSQFGVFFVGVSAHASEYKLTSRARERNEKHYGGVCSLSNKKDFLVNIC